MEPRSSKWPALAVGFAALTCVALANGKAPKVNMKPGMWETSITMSMPGMPMAMPPITTAACLTEKDLVPKFEQPGQECKVTKQKVSGNTVEWAMRCQSKDGNVLEHSGKVTYSGNAFTGTMQMTMPGQASGPGQMTYQAKGKRLGPCKKK